MKKGYKLNFIVETKRFKLNSQILSSILKRTIDKMGYHFNIQMINLLFCNFKRMEELNYNFLKRKGATDVLSFVYPALNKKNEVIIEIAVCVDEAKLQARNQQKELSEELLFLILHGLLHSFGYTHKSGIKRLQNKLFRGIREEFGEVIKTLFSE
jgi:probable rRNA maturation factor